ncbi:hypothetical protein CPB97_005188, partial [Podila verticillata]
FQKSQYSKDDLERGKNEKDGEVKRLEEELGKAKKETARAERIRKEKRRLVRGPHTPGRRSYLHARDTLREAYANQQHIQHALDKAKKERTWFNQVHDVAGSAASGSAVTRPPVLTAASKSHYRFEEDSRKLDINSLLEDQNVVVAFAATDYGVKKMSETVFLPRPVLEAHLNQFAILEDMDSEQMPGSDQIPSRQTVEDKVVESLQIKEAQAESEDIEMVDTELAPQGAPVDAPVQGNQPPLGPADSTPESTLQEQKPLSRIPTTHTITAPYISAISHSRVNAQCRNKRLKAKKKESKKVRHALRQLQRPGVSQRLARSLQQLDASIKAHRKHAPAVESFENSKRHLKEKHNQKLRTDRARQVVTAHERRGAIESAREYE